MTIAIPNAPKRTPARAQPTDLVGVSGKLSRAVDKLSFGEPVTHVYNPLAYARAPHDAYLTRFGQGPKEVLLVGMNPGPFGMTQTGVPFGEVAAVRDFLGIDEPVGRPKREHPKRPVTGFGCVRSEVSGSRLWGWARERFGSAEAFHERFFIVNYCPLVFLEESGRNRTPDKLPASESRPLMAACDEALRSVARLLKPRYVVGVGAFAAAKARAALEGFDVELGVVLHPSPASPKANRGWAAAAEADLEAMGIRLGEPSGHAGTKR